eukprot:m.15105 g.15105  ORF g.15105 m.15105 type:complete len:534 (+) comp4960_c0_seq1:76-1677(+)
MAAIVRATTAATAEAVSRLAGRTASSSASAAGTWRHEAPAVLLPYINGASHTPAASAGLPLRDVVHPASGEVLTQAVDCDAAVVDAAVDAAKVAQSEWAKLGGIERAHVMRRAALILRERNDELARVEALDTGRAIAETLVVDVVSAIDALEYFSGVASTLGGQHVQMPGGNWAYTVREPLGVCAGIGAWNYPLQSAAFKLAPALACGNALVFKPAEDTPNSAVLLAGVLSEAGAPDGLFNVVLGAGETGQLLSRHEGIAKVSFTGEAGTGKLVCRDASHTLKKVTMELGGKSPLVIFSDADMDNAVAGAMMANFYSTGQVCSNAARVFVHRDILEEFTARVVARTKKLTIGDPMDKTTDVGSLITHEHLGKVMSYIDEAKADERAQLLCGGNVVSSDALPPHCANGPFVEPTIFAGCTDDMRIVREEVFGPVMTILPFDDEAEVVARANDTPFGLSAGVFTNDLTRAHRVIGQLQAGTCWINNYNLAPVELPWGGYKQSGLGRENGVAAMEYWTQLKSVYVEMGNVDCPYKE